MSPPLAPNSPLTKRDGRVVPFFSEKTGVSGGKDTTLRHRSRPSRRGSTSLPETHNLEVYRRSLSTS